jgi:hypothetical protein
MSTSCLAALQRKQHSNASALDPTVQIIEISPVPSPNKLKTRRGRHLSASEAVLKTILYGNDSAQHRLRRDLSHDKSARKILGEVKDVPRPESGLEPRAICLVHPELHKCQHTASSMATDLVVDPELEASSLSFVNLYALAANPAAFVGQQGAFDALAALAARLSRNGNIGACPRDRMILYLRASKPWLPRFRVTDCALADWYGWE